MSTTVKASDQSGPFGNYKRGSFGHVLNALCHYGIPLSKVEQVTLAGDGEIKLDGRQFCTYRYFDGISEPLFRFVDPVYSQQRAVLQNGGSAKPAFKLQLSSHASAGLIVNGSLASKELHAFVKDIMSSNMLGDEKYELRQKCGAFFQGGSDSPDGEWIYIEFWKPKHAQEFVDYVNNNFTYPKNL